MKKTAILLVVFIAALLMAYLVGSFVAASFDIKVWSMFWRACIGVGGTMLAVLATIAASELDTK